MRERRSVVGCRAISGATFMSQSTTSRPWLLVGWEAILRQARIERKKPWGANPEDIDRDKPPAHRLRELFQNEGKRSDRRYSKPIDGKKLFEALDLVEVARRCPEFKSFLNCLLELAGCTPLR